MICTNTNRVQMKPPGILALEISSFKMVRPPVKLVQLSATTGREIQVPAKLAASQKVTVGVAA
jgi:hypothetical protein